MPELSDDRQAIKDAAVEITQALQNLMQAYRILDAAEVEPYRTYLATLIPNMQEAFGQMIFV